ncbi:RNA-protein complex protein Nop10 [Candidatus Woesearchaeota archaeon]|nr:RNA-protein complex protein Nop10 [Candidatus Woesearchaeota archaeon]
MKKILKCANCGEYTLKENCSCGGTAVIIKPPKYSPEDKYGKYRRKAKCGK